MFDTVAGLPLHPLVVHAVVVLLPLAALATVAVAVRARWRPHARWVLGLNVLVLVVAFVAKESGEALEHRLERSFGADAAIERHAELGDLVPVFAVLLVVAAAVVLAAATRPRLAPLAVVVAVAAAIAGIGWTVVTGDTGARSVWEETIANTTG